MVVVVLEVTPNEMLEGSIAWQYDVLFHRMHGKRFTIDSNNRIIACCSFNTRQCGSNGKSGAIGLGISCQMTLFWCCPERQQPRGTETGLGKFRPQLQNLSLPLRFAAEHTTAPGEND